jgi:hypothetical protein
MLRLSAVLLRKCSSMLTNKEVFHYENNVKHYQSVLGA